MELFLGGIAAALAIVVFVLWARTRAAADARFRQWRDDETERIHADARRVATAQAVVDLERWQADRETAIRRDAIARSSSTVLGKTTEHLAPYLGEFPYNPRDVRFIGSPIDLVVFDGLDAGDVKRVVLVEIKSGASQLSARQRQVRDALKRGAFSWEEWRLPGP